MVAVPDYNILATASARALKPLAVIRSLGRFLIFKSAIKHLFDFIDSWYC